MKNRTSYTMLVRWIGKIKVYFLGGQSNFLIKDAFVF